MKSGALLLFLVLPALAQPINLAGPWKLKLEDNPAGHSPGIDDSAWKTVVLPHRTPQPEKSVCVPDSQARS